LCNLSRRFSSLFREEECSVCLIIAEARVGRRHDFANRFKAGGGESAA
jgi:hypothetical protein